MTVSSTWSKTTKNRWLVHCTAVILVSACATGGIAAWLHFHKSTELREPQASEDEQSSGKPVALTDGEKKELDELIRDFLFDPNGAERVSFRVTVYSPSGGSGKAEFTGWLVKGMNGDPDRLYFADRYTIATSQAEEIRQIDFLKECRERFRSKPKTNDREEFFTELYDDIEMSDPDLAMAAWLHRLGNDDLAARALPPARGEATHSPGDGEVLSRRELLRDKMSWRAFSGLVHGFVNHADEDALVHGEWLFSHYKDIAEKRNGFLWQSAQIFRELKRRKQAGTFGKLSVESPPPELAKMNSEAAVKYLIGQLDEVDARQFMQPGGVPLKGNWRVQALIKIGEPAIPALIECVEKDERLTRSVHYWRDFSRHRTVLSVREAALGVIESILRVSFFQRGSTADSFTSGGDDEVKRVVTKLHQYWSSISKMPLGADEKVKSNQPAENKAADDDAKTITAAIEHFSNQKVEWAFTGREYKKVIAIDKVSLGPALIYLSDDQLSADLRDEKWEIPNELRENMRQRNARVVSLSNLKFGKAVLVADLGNISPDLDAKELAKPLGEAKAYAHVWLPGYSKSGSTAVVRFFFGPTSHGATATYLLSKTDGVWKVMKWAFAYYV
jgi:hypothetical protein